MSDRNILIKINRKKCISCGLCATIAPKTFKLDDQQISCLVNDPHDNKHTILKAVKSCPTGAISIKDWR